MPVVHFKVSISLHLSTKMSQQVGILPIEPPKTRRFVMYVFNDMHLKNLQSLNE